MIFILKIFSILSVSFALTEADTRPTECDPWESVASDMMDQEFLNMTCASNVLCSGFSCSGFSLFEITHFTDRDRFGFAVEFSECSYPLILRIHLNSSDLKFTKLLKVHGQNEETISLVTPDNAGGEVLFGRLNVGWNVVQKPAKYLVALEVNFTRIFPYGEFLAIPLVPLRSYPVPNCQNRSSSVAVEAPEAVGCEGSECYSRFQNPVRGEATRSFHSGLLLRVGVGIGALVVILLVFFGYIFIRRRHRRSRKLRKLAVDNDLKGESEEDFEEEDSITSSRDSPDDQRNLLRL